MSWLLSQFSNLSFPPPADSIRPAQKRLLEEPPRPRGPIPPQPEEAASISQTSSSQVDRPNRNKVIFAAGLGFFTFSLLITRRSFARRRLASAPSFYTNTTNHNAEQSGKVNGAMEAMEALNVATINVLSLAMMATGGTLWYFNINNMTDARRFIRGGLGVDGTGKSEQEAEEEIEEWMATVLARKDAKEGKR